VAPDALIVLMNDAAIEYAVDTNASVLLGGAEVEGVPIAEPEVEFVILGSGTRRDVN